MYNQFVDNSETYKSELSISGSESLVVSILISVNLCMRNLVYLAIWTVQSEVDMSAGSRPRIIQIEYQVLVRSQTI